MTSFLMTSQMRVEVLRMAGKTSMGIFLNYTGSTHIGQSICNISEIANRNCTITAEIHARTLANFYCQYADRHMNLKFIRRVSEREPAIRQINKLMSVFNASVLLLIMNFVITLSK